MPNLSVISVATVWCLSLQDEVDACLDIFLGFVAETNKQLVTKPLDVRVSASKLCHAHVTSSCCAAVSASHA